jgi:hypothetical protein
MARGSKPTPPYIPEGCPPELACDILRVLWGDHLNGYMNITLEEVWCLMRDESKHPGNDVIRVLVNDDGTVNLLDFTLARRSARERKNLAQKDVPVWIMETISMLRIAKEGDLVPGLGFKVSDCLYYIVERNPEE